MPPEIETQEQGAQVGGLDSLLVEASAIEGASAPPDQGAQQQEQDRQEAEKQSQEFAEVMDFAWHCIGPMLPDRYAERYDEKARAAIAKAWGPLAVKRGWSMGEALGKYGPELAFAAAIAMPAFPVAMADWKRSREQKRQPANRPVQPLRPPPEEAEGVRP